QRRSLREGRCTDSAGYTSSRGCCRPFDGTCRRLGDMRMDSHRPDPGVAGTGPPSQTVRVTEFLPPKPSWLSEPSPVERLRHCWVTSDEHGRVPALLLEWRETAHGWQGRVVRPMLDVEDGK